MIFASFTNKNKSWKFIILVSDQWKAHIFSFKSVLILNLKDKTSVVKELFGFYGLMMVVSSSRFILTGNGYSN